MAIVEITKSNSMIVAIAKDELYRGNLLPLLCAQLSARSSYIVSPGSVDRLILIYLLI